MTNTIAFSSNRTFGAGDDGVLMRITGAATLTIPADATHKFKINDVIDIFRDSTAAVSIVVASTSVRLSAVGAFISKQCGWARFKKIADNRWIGWGDLSA